MSKVTYEQIAQLYNECSQGNARPDCTFSSEVGLRKVFGDEEVDRTFAEGRARYLTFDEEMWQGSAHELAAHPVTPQWLYLVSQGRAVEVYEPWNTEPEGDTDATS